jgi:hypothetical protein
VPEGTCICEDCLDLVTQRAAKYGLEKSLAKRDVAYTENNLSSCGGFRARLRESVGGYAEHSSGVLQRSGARLRARCLSLAKTCPAQTQWTAATRKYLSFAGNLPNGKIAGGACALRNAACW